MSNFSLLPSDAPVSRRLSSSTVKALALLIVAVIVGFAGKQHFGSQRDDAQAAFNQAKAQQDKLDLETETIRQQLSAVASAGGKERLQLVEQLVKSRQNWQKVLLAVINATEPGITISTFNATNPASAPADPTATPNQQQTADVTMAGTANSRGALQTLVERLRRQSAFTNVKLRKATQVAGKYEWNMELGLKPAGPLPAAPAAAGTSAPATGATATP